MSDLEQRLAKLQRQFQNLRIMGGEGVIVHGSPTRGYALEIKAAAADSGTGGGGPGPTPTGACCIGASCSVLTATDCATMSGVYRGDGVPCAEHTCACFALSFSGTVSGTGDPGSVETDTGPCHDLVSVDGSASGSASSMCFSNCDCIDSFTDTSSSSATWGCSCSGCTTSFFPQLELQLSGTWGLTISNLIGINCDRLISGSCLAYAPFASLDSPHLFDLGADPTGMHTLTFTGDVTGFSYSFNVTVA